MLDVIVHAASGVKKYVTVLNTGISKMQDANTVLLQYMQLVKGLLISLTINTFTILSHFAMLTLWLVKTEGIHILLNSSVFLTDVKLFDLILLHV